MCAAGYLIVKYLPAEIGFADAVNLAGHMGKMNALDFKFDWNDRYNFWSGMTGGLFLALSYFGTDQSQVGRYIGGASIAESRLGLLFNGLLKIPMQFLILLLGVLLFVFYQFYTPPLFFNQVEVEKIKNSKNYADYQILEQENNQLSNLKKEGIIHLHQAIKNDDRGEIAEAKGELQSLQVQNNLLRNKTQSLLLANNPKADTKDTDYIFISFILSKLPVGLVGLLLAVIFSAAMSSMSAGLNSLGATTCIDVYKRIINPSATDRQYVNASKLFTVMWGLLAIVFAFLASMVDNLIQAVNILGSLFYGTILGIFLAAFYVKFIHSKAVFIAALIAEVIILLLYFYTPIAYLWYNVIGCLLVIVIAAVIQLVSNASQKGS